MQLRTYQIQAKESIKQAWSEVDKTLLVLPTGTGKTIVFAKLAAELVSEGKRILILAHRGELLDQAADKIATVTGLGCAVEKADKTAKGEWYRITVGSVQSLMRKNRLNQFKSDYYNVIIIDEAHHCLSDSYQRVLSYFSSAKILGVTATPDRGDKKSLGQFFETLAYEYTLPKAIKEGYLSKIKALTIPLKIELGKLSTQAGDFKLSELDGALAPYICSIAEQMKDHCFERKTVVFLPLIATSQKMCEVLNANGFRAAEVNGTSKDRSEILQDFAAGKYNILCNSMLLTEGWDCPSVDCIVCLRPTKIRSLYCQIVGRGTRINPGKEDLLLLDFLWHSEKHELCRPAHIIAESKDVADIMTQKLEEAQGTALDIEELEQEAKGDAIAEREEALAKQLEGMKHRKRKLVDPLQYEMSIQDEDLTNYTPSFGWEMAPASDKQIKALENKGISPDVIECAGKASLMLDRLNKRKKEGLTTPKQIRFLENKGFKHVGTWSFDKTKKLIDRIAANRWQIPSDINSQTYEAK